MKQDRTGLRYVVWVPDPAARDGHLRIQIRAGSPPVLDGRSRFSIEQIVGLSQANPAPLAHRTGEIDWFPLMLMIRRV